MDGKCRCFHKKPQEPTCIVTNAGIKFIGISLHFMRSYCSFLTKRHIQVLSHVEIVTIRHIKKQPVESLIDDQGKEVDAGI